ncbi:hypothetical protein A3863_14360 [Priestia endophytica]|uniref:Uncharacterized protein n=1 Tax=Priestia endophytica TaxID=135735 RepID=A0AAX1QDE0_9BACI|nr:hypothetical protein A3864_07485 [Priestia endophytica]RAS88232.1 hypothetical protein A3863_14360 [Priestia endophytica]
MKKPLLAVKVRHENREKNELMSCFYTFIATFKYGSIFLYVYSNNFDRTVVLLPAFYTNSLVTDLLLFHLNEQLLILFLSFLSKWKTSPHLPQGSLSYFYLNSVSKIYMDSNLKNWLN